MLAASGVAICALVAGCGGGNDELSRGEFVRQAEAICSKARHKASENFSNSANGDIAPSVAAVLSKEADEIDALDGPSNDASQIEAIVDTTREAADTIEANENDLAKAETSMNKAEKLASTYGLKSCLLY